MLMKYCSSIIVAICMFVVLSGCGAIEDVDLTKPYVVSTTPSNGATGVARDTQELTIVFSEEMSPEGNVSASSGWPLSNSTAAHWSTDRKTFYISRDNAASPLPANTSIDITLNNSTGLYHFKDIAGNVLDTYMFSFTTGD